MTDVPPLDADVRAFIEANPSYTVAAEQPAYRGGTNHVTFGRRGREEVVFKRFCHASRWANELFCLRHFERSGLVPQVLDAVEDRLIVMRRLGGDDLMAVIRNAEPLRARLSQSLGHALARWCREASPPARSAVFGVIPWDPRPSAAVTHYLRLSRAVQRSIPAYREPDFDASLRLIENRLGALDAERRVLFHEDISNTRAEGDRVLGFYDLEMCREGTVSMQLGVALNLCGAVGLDWGKVRSGFETSTGVCLSDEDLDSVLAMSHFYGWIRICRWGFWDGSPASGHHLEASAREARAWRERFSHAREVIGAGCR